MTELEERIIELAKTDPQRFFVMLGEHSTVQLKVCILKQDGKSQMQIGRKLNLTKRQVQHRKCGSC